ncbi:MAG: SAM-dependent methyltransferase [Nitrospinae bacterium RIFCSPLOWO2_02_39_17]|nr:MAG: SAM-dependent methyltransferase [Nitrospinae bacterium RIFCSPHIGHO2_02_39_11]OGV99192.1 MAG: SAM-dependent methyltransferase [Nitrospinae bacterium RIFCSPHIGHO2_12_FULL_39_42]OGW01491.1 MAG: SAM-dependent methyltransferase [Nitrospinae bacterium RIFCSPLOWO2_02_39_17]OGW08685.1 MAG: SAM-dependent methyltransferase [Nitrospinae bacterium RIFCSPLOWO2_12_FULL_39_93]OGW09443.1 MAG: SAM-dependent methyltransferase [Nitrospinae bacterium RIFCSPLOWO2_12_39_15]
MQQDIKLKKGADKRIRSGHLWIFSNEITDKLKKYKGGDIADLYSYKGEFLGRGYINPLSLIAIRILTYKKEDIDTNFFYNRINRALSYRKEMYPDANSYRVVFGESDFLPGLIVDKYEDYLIVQILSLGMEIRKDTILNALEDVFHPAGIIERNDVAVRELEGLKIHKGILKGDLKDNIIIRENGVKFEVDILNGQKTGFFFDQRENRQVIKKYVKKGGRVLDCFCYSGAWSIHSARNGADEVIGLDSSDDAIKLAKRNAEINGFSERCRFKNVDVFDELRRLVSVGEKFDAIILDPPAFVKSAGKVKEALKGYKEINLQAMKLLKNGGILITCSCSYHIDKETFRDMLIQAASDSERDFRIIEFRGQAPDHPVLLSMRETEYLKCAVLKMG